ncbi:hypothetical protein J6590_005303 [Homalodisca vitripennis]|nr:hypothetical protein J6590_005303 [Homalodisca vitripennis]
MSKLPRNGSPNESEKSQNFPVVSHKYLPSTFLIRVADGRSGWKYSDNLEFKFTFEASVTSKRKRLPNPPLHATYRPPSLWYPSGSGSSQPLEHLGFRQVYPLTCLKTDRYRTLGVSGRWKLLPSRTSQAIQASSRN